MGTTAGSTLLTTCSRRGQGQSSLEAGFRNSQGSTTPPDLRWKWTEKLSSPRKWFNQDQKTTVTGVNVLPTNTNTISVLGTFPASAHRVFSWGEKHALTPAETNLPFATKWAGYLPLIKTKQSFTLITILLSHTVL